MTGTRTRQLALLGLLVVVVTGAFLNWPFGGSSGTPGTASGPGGGGPGGAGDTPGIDVRLESLRRDPGPLSGPERNPFRFERREAESAPSRPSSRRPAPVVTPQPEGPVLPPPPPPIPLRFIGFLQPRGDVRVAVLSDGRGNIFDGKEGDVIEGRYRLLRVGNDSADLIYLDGRGRQTIRLSGQ
jgi:hypothetical protein